MKSFSGYVILIISFCGLRFIKHELDILNNVDLLNNRPRKSDLSQRQMKERISSIEDEVDSLRHLLNNKDVAPTAPVIPDPPITPQVMLSPESFKLDVDLSPHKVEKKRRDSLGWRWSSEYNTIDDAVKVRDSKNEFSKMAQQEINTAYELGGGTWYGAEEAWNSLSFKKRIIDIRNKSE